MMLTFYMFLSLTHLGRSDLVNQVVIINGSRDIGVDYQLDIDADAETMTL